MKRSLLFFLLLWGFTAFAQYNLEVLSANELLGGEYRKALAVNVYESDLDAVERAYKAELKKFGGKLTSKKEIFIDDALIEKMGSNTFDVYTRLEADKDGKTVRIFLAVDLGGAFLDASNHPEQYQYMSSWLKQFAVETTKNAMDEKVKEAEKNFKNLEKDLEKLKSDKKDLEKSIEDYKERIKKAEADIDKNGKDQELKKTDIETKAKELDALKNKAISIK